ncbi:tetraacyldisaccharide 4'-kinase [Pontibacter sp. CAU 1760]
MKYVKCLLWPFSLLYGGIMVVRNKLYDHGVLPSRQFNLPVIAVGNLTVGGTGKTPHVEYLLRLLHHYKTATLSRGYKRQSKGFILADASSSALSIGDEPYQYYRDFEGVAVAVSEDRVHGIEELRKRVPEVEAVVLDDAMQHRPVQPSLSLMLTDYHRLFYKDFVMPAGLLREPRTGASRADAIIVSKCPLHLSEKEQEAIRYKIQRYASQAVPVFFTAFRYGAPVPLQGGITPGKKVVLLTGIANAEPLKENLAQQGYTLLHHAAFPDHHLYEARDIETLQQLLAKPAYQGAAVLTTRKDAVKLADAKLSEALAGLPVFYVPIEVEFLQDQGAFDRLVLQHVQDFGKPGSAKL